MCKSWITARNEYKWTVDLSHYRWARKFPRYFSRVITPETTTAFEDRLRHAIESHGSFLVTGEVCFWKNYGNAQNRDRLTTRLLKHLHLLENWTEFIQAVEQLADTPSYNNFKAVQSACAQPSGFATPITFLAFYRPDKYPMADKHIAYWWRTNKERFGYGNSPGFSQRYDGWIQPVERSWKAYVSWAVFCRDYAKRVMKNCKLNWRARDIEMAIWEARKRNASQNELPK